MVVKPFVDLQPQERTKPAILDLEKCKDMAKRVTELDDDVSSNFASTVARIIQIGGVNKQIDLLLQKSAKRLQDCSYSIKSGFTWSFCKACWRS